MRKITSVLFLLLALAACQPAPPTTVPAALPSSAATVTKMPAPTATPTLTPVPTATATATPTSTATATNTATPVPTATPSHPLMIPVMRSQEYPGSEIVFEETLAPGVNYDRYIISYQSEGNKIYALFTVPWGTPPESGWPVILFNHGWIRPEEYVTTERYLDYVDAIARSGYIVLRSDYRGHGRSEGEAIISYRSPGYTADVLNALASVQGYSAADPDRIGMWGHSMGGHITLRAMVVSDQVRAGVIWGGVVVSFPDLFTKWTRYVPPGQPTPTPRPTRAGSWRNNNSWYALYGTPEENPDFWQAMSANNYLDEISGPLQLHHGTADASVPYEFSEILAAEMEAANQPVELYLYDGDNHNLVISFWTAMNRSLAFFDRYVKG